MLSRLLTAGKLSIKMKLILILTTILLSGLAVSNYYNYIASRQSVRENIINGILPLTRDNIYSEIQTNLIRPAFLSSTNLPGVPGVGLKMDTITALLKSYKEKYGSVVYLTDIAGIVQAHPNEKLTEQADIHKLKGIKDIAETILTSKSETAMYEFERNNEHILLTVRYIPEFNWFLFVEIDENSKMGNTMKNIIVNLLVGILISCGVIGICIFVVNHFQSRLEHMAVTDELTGANNRREFDLQFRKSVYNYNRSGTPFSIIIFDIDHFKSINDTMGHITGDSSIKTIAVIARSEMRLTDVLVRWGGDEFIILTHGDEDSALSAAERIRKQVEASEFFKKHDNRDQEKCDITISCGVSGFKKGDTLDSILARADSALYKAKHDGRNRIYRG